MDDGAVSVYQPNAHHIAYHARWRGLDRKSPRQTSNENEILYAIVCCLVDKLICFVKVKAHFLVLYTPKNTQNKNKQYILLFLRMIVV